MVALPEAAIVPSEQVKLGLPEQLPWDGVTVPRVKPAGQMSDTLTAWASEGPPVVTVVVHVRVTPSPAMTWVTPSLLTMLRSAWVATVVVSVELLLAGLGSWVRSDVAVAVLLMTVPAGTFALTVAWMVTLTEPPATMS